MTTGIAESITPQDVIDVLNRALDEDPTAIAALATNRVPCNEALAGDPTIQVWGMNGGYQLGLLGILNGLFGLNEDGWGAIGADFDGHEIQRFRVLTEEDREFARGEA